MKPSRWLLVVVIGVVILAGVVGLSHLATAQEANPGPTAPPTEATGAPAQPSPPALLPEPNPIVSVVVGTSETEYEEDPFEPSQVRSATTRVRTLLYIRADGSVETKQVS